MNAWLECVLAGSVVVGSVVATGCGAEDTGETVGEGSETAPGSSGGGSGGSAEETTIPGTGTESESASASASASTVAQTETGSTAGETTAGDTTSGEPLSCATARTERQCTTIEPRYETCAWLPSTVVAGGGCREVPDTGFEGACTQATQDDSCGPPSTPTCPDGITMVYYRELGLEIGAVELVSFEAETLCEGPGDGFALCTYTPGDPDVFDPPECACACPA